MKRIFSAINGISGIPRRIMLGGLLPALVLLLLALCLFLRQEITYEEIVLSRQICETGVALFSEGMVLGLFVDVLLKRK